MLLISCTSILVHSKMMIQLMMDKYTGKAFVVVQLLSHVQLFMTPWTAACQASVFLYYLPEFAQTHIHWVKDAIQSSHPLWFPFPTTLSFPVSESFPVSWLFILGGQSIGASTSTSVLPINIQGWFPLGLTGLISLLSKRLSSVFSSITV